MPLRLRRGTNAERQSVIFAEGELIYITDDKKLYVGDGVTTGGVDFVGGANGDLSSDLTLNGYNITGSGNINTTGNINLTGNIVATGNITIADINANGIISNGVLTINGNTVASDTGYISSGLGNTIGIIELSTETNLLQVKRSWKDSNEPHEVLYGITNNFAALITHKYASRGTLSFPDATITGDNISLERFWGHDGFDYVLSSSVWHGVDPNATPNLGFMPGAIAFITEGVNGPNIAGFDSNGRFGIGKFPEPANEALDVVGNGIFSGTVYASNFVGSVSADDSTLLVDSLNATVGNGTVTIDGSGLKSNNTFTTTGIAAPCGILELSTENDLLQIRRYWKETTSPIEAQYGITEGFYSLVTNKYASRGTLSSPQTLFYSDGISQNNYYAHDGNDYTLTSTLWHGLDAEQSISPGNAYGSIAFIMQGPLGTKVSGFNSKGWLNIDSTTSPPEGHLDVHGSAFVRDTLTVKQTNPALPNLSLYGITNNVSANVISTYASRGTLTAPTATVASDAIALENHWGHDGTDYVLASSVFHGIDPFETPGPGYMPGNIGFVMYGPDGLRISGFNSRGYLGINRFPDPATEALDVNGNAIIRGNVTAAAYKGTFVGDDSTIIIDGLTGNVVGNEITAAAFKGTFVADDSTIVVDGLNGNVTGNTVTSNGFVMFGSYDATGRSNLSAANGMVIYNTTANRFQGYQNGAWINLDDGSAAP